MVIAKHVNQSGASYADARLKLIAGDVQRAQPRREAMVPQAAPAMRAMEKAADGFVEKAFFEYHLYTLGRTASIPRVHASKASAERTTVRALGHRRRWCVDGAYAGAKNGAEM